MDIRPPVEQKPPVTCASRGLGRRITVALGEQGATSTLRRAAKRGWVRPLFAYGWPVRSVSRFSSAYQAMKPRGRALSGKDALHEVPIDQSSVATEKPRYCKPFVTEPYSGGTKEHFRDINVFGFTLHRFFIVLWLIGSGFALFFVQQWIWPGSFSAQLVQGLNRTPAWSWIGCIWLIALPTSLASVVGNLMFVYPPRWLDDVKPHSYNVVFRIVSRGTNSECLLETMYSVRKAMQDDALFPYLVEVVTDAGVFTAPDEKDFVQIKVPMDYKSPNDAKFKARALHYATIASGTPDNAWVVHLDEETRPTSSGIKGIAHFVAEAEAGEKVRHIGQGCMMYHRQWAKHPYLTLADMRRTGDDMGLFYLQHTIGRTLIGLHGSYIVCRQDIERELGFDLGPQGSITEDAWWALLAMDKGYRTKWCHGYLDEQSTQSIMDFVKQRRRWYVGLWKVCIHCTAPLKHRLVLSISTAIWVLIPLFLPFVIIYVTLLSYYRFPVPFFLRFFTNFIISANMIVYFAGLVANMREHGTTFLEGIFWMLMMAIAMPMCYLMEAAAVIMTFFYPFSANAKGFHVVNKSPSGQGYEYPSVKRSTEPVLTSMSQESMASDYDFKQKSGCEGNGGAEFNAER